MRKSSDEKKIEEKPYREELTAKERRRLQNRIAQRNHRKKNAQLNGNEEQKSRERSMAHVDGQTQPSNNVKYNEQALDVNSGNTHGCQGNSWHEHNSSKFMEGPRYPSKGRQSHKHTLRRRHWEVGLPNSPDFSTPFDGTYSDISSPAAHSYTPTLATIESCPPLSSAQTPVSEDYLSLIGVPPGWPGNIFAQPRRLRSYSENTGTISQNSPLLMHPENHPEFKRSQTDAEGKMALHLSAKNRYTNIVRCLLDFGSEINRRDGCGATALHYAAATGNVNVISTLLERGADGNITDIQGRTALHIAAERGHETAVRILIQSGVSVDIQIQRKQVSNRFNT
ncbi:hypothetical protein ACJ73_01396 [Blastomyces percursus]|uniref:BZIP domain-containing protein n=1 Tax=Blastomyces percursus TaxID=1658174 RepID=A0A1J9RGU2_9EURO|nr:hypothetical protein ACJ73_01396 [Blastomyces percursus]